MRPAAQGQRLVIAMLVLLGVLFALPGCGMPFASCSSQSEAFLADVQTVAREWDDATKLAGQTPRMSLATQIQTLQAIRRKAQDLKPPECATKVQTELIASMDNTINGFLDFLAQKPESEVNTKFENASSHLKAFGDAIAEIRGSPTSPTMESIFKQINSGLK